MDYTTQTKIQEDLSDIYNDFHNNFESLIKFNRSWSEISYLQFEEENFVI